MLRNVPSYIRFLAVLLLAVVFVRIGVTLLRRKYPEKFARERRPRSSLAAVTGLTAAAVLLVWGAAMARVTVDTARDLAENYDRMGRNLCEAARQWARLDEDMDPDNRAYWIWQALDYSAGGAYEARVSDGDRGFSSRDIDSLNAVVFYDGDREPVAWTGDFLYFNYDTQEVWDSALDPDHTVGRCGAAWAPVDIAALEENVSLPEELSLDSFVSQVEAMRLTGTLEGDTLALTRAEYVDSREFNAALFARTPDEVIIDNKDGSKHVSYDYSVSEVISTENIPWHTLYDGGPPGEHDVTLYTTRPRLCVSPGRDSGLVESLLKIGTQGGIYTAYSTPGLREMTVYGSSTVSDWESYVPDGNDGELWEVDFIVTSAQRFYPMRDAVVKLRSLYVFTGLLALLACWALVTVLKNQLIAPVRTVNEHIDQGWAALDGSKLAAVQWREPRALLDNYRDAQETRLIRRSEITRLNTALTYAQNAERDRRQMTSNLAHELKTPLAVIHSYAEGLREHIAEDKRDRYIDVILTEAERTDGLVLEMLDLSRLEAGKVKLTQDSFSLGELTRSVFEKLELAAQERELRIDLDLPEDTEITADEGRIGQVVENFASNAVKYTPAGGHILASVRKDRSGVTFTLENDSEPLSEDALGHVWEPFYRADQARSGGGTGLGLAIARNIVELHGGTCAVRNTSTGVAFSFTLPRR